MVELFVYHQSDKCTRKDCRITGIITITALLIVGVLLIATMVPVSFHLGRSGSPEMLSQGQTRIVEGRDSTFCSGLVLNITSKRTTVTLYRLSQSPQAHDSNITINSYITERNIESCSAGKGHGQECTVSNDRSSTYVVTTSSGPPHETSVRVQVNCQLAGGPTAGIVIGILMVYVLFCTGLFVGILCCAQCIDNNSK